MGYASKLGRARISARNPQAAGVCDRCGFVYSRSDLSWQMDWGGASLINKRILVCDTCNDVPQQQLRSIVIPADPVPVVNPRTQDYGNTESDYRTTQGNTVNSRTGIPVPGGDVRSTQDNNNRVTQQTGQPNGATTPVPGIILTNPDYGNPSFPYNMTGVPETGPSPGMPLVVWNNSLTDPLAWVNNSGGVLIWTSAIQS
jgi:hypothetical protein